MCSQSIEVLSRKTHGTIQKTHYGILFRVVRFVCTLIYFFQLSHLEDHGSTRLPLSVLRC